MIGRGSGERKSGSAQESWKQAEIQEQSDLAEHVNATGPRSWFVFSHLVTSNTSERARLLGTAGNESRCTPRSRPLRRAGTGRAAAVPVITPPLTGLLVSV